MRVGSLVYATEQGLGRLAKSFVDAGVVTDPLVVVHSKHPTQPWYEGAPSMHIKALDSAKLRRWAKGLDALLCFETPFDWSLFDYCRSERIRTALLTMYECTPKALPSRPDVFICPSDLDARHFPGCVRLDVPTEVPFKLRTTAHMFVHNAGNCGLRGRNGTKELLQACALVRKPVELILRYQERCCDGLPEELTTAQIGKATVHMRPGTADYETLWSEGDAFVFPEKFNGLSLPLQEAFLSGMLVMGADRFPMNEWLPQEPLIQTSGSRRACVSGRYIDFDEAIVEPGAIAEAIDRWNGADVEKYSEIGRLHRDLYSWSRLKPKYMEALCA